ncbi:MAG TPA: vitamin K epoxide reductase family protein [Methylomirabilota bacterium]|nr:vitamin K epoxide reductase family protein [Methylomirabilota bacterium]
MALATVGAGIAIHLTITKLVQTAPLLCSAGGSCEIVQASHYALLLGVPTALWGAALYVALGVLGARPLTRRRWLWAFGLSAAGVAFSGYLTGVSLLVLRAACGWCLTSAVIVLAILVALLRRRPAPGTRWAWLRPARLAMLGGLVVLTTVGVSFALFNASGAGSPYQEALARHLRDTGAQFYGAHWCPACREQKRLFGNAAGELPYVECDPAGAGARPDLCKQAEVRTYPTWTIRGGRHEGVTSLDTLAKLSGFAPPRAGR